MPEQAEVRVKHPAKWTPAILDAIEAVLTNHYPEVKTVLDPFAGTGGIHRLRGLDIETTGVELEPEWAEQHPCTEVGDALRLRFEVGSFDAVVTSPTYGNRMADHHEARDNSTRFTYRHMLGRPLTAGSSAGLAWGREYRRFHEQAWVEAIRVTTGGGLIVLNTKNFYEDNGNRLHRVTEFHLSTLMALGCTVEMVIPVAVKGNGTNQEKRAEHETVMFCRTPTTYQARML
jgi:tRNA G10  N-methylase Trm11